MLFTRLRRICLSLVLVGSVLAWPVWTTELLAQQPIPREVRKELERLEARTPESFEQGDFQQELADHLAWEKFCLQYLAENDPRLRKQQVRRRSVERVLALSAAEQERIREARRQSLKVKELYDQGATEQAAEQARLATATLRELLGDGDYFTLETRWVELSVAHNSQAGENLETPLKEVIESFETLLGKEHPLIATKRFDLAQHYCSQQRWDEAERTLEQVREIRARHDLPLDEEWFKVQLAWSRVLLKVHRQAEAQQAAEQLIAVASTDEPYRKNELLGYLVLGQCQVRQQHYSQAISTLQHALQKLHEYKFSPDTELAVESLQELSLAYRKENRVMEAEQAEQYLAEVQEKIKAAEKRRR